VPLPVEIVNLLTPDHIHSALDRTEHWLLSKVTGEVGDRLWKAALRRFAPMLNSEDYAALKIRIERLEAFTAGFEQERVSANTVNSDVETENASEPAFDDFLGRAVESAGATPSEGKQLLLGRLAGKRAGTATESFLDLQLRAALDITDRATLPQLYAVGALLLVARTPLPPPPADVRAILADLDRSYAEALAAMLEAPWTVSDLQYLTSIGAMRFSSTNEMMEGITSRFGRLVAPGGRYQPVPMNPVTAHNSVFWSLLEQYDTKMTGAQTNHRSFVSYDLTPTGMVLGVAIVESLCGVSIGLPPEWKSAR